VSVLVSSMYNGYSHYEREFSLHRLARGNYHFVSILLLLLVDVTVEIVSITHNLFFIRENTCSNA
jgi:hypothetical protein